MIAKTVQQTGDLVIGTFFHFFRIQILSNSISNVQRPSSFEVQNAIVAFIFINDSKQSTDVVNVVVALQIHLLPSAYTMMFRRLRNSKTEPTVMNPIICIIDQK